MPCLSFRHLNAVSCQSPARKNAQSPQINTKCTGLRDIRIDAWPIAFRPFLMMYYVSSRASPIRFFSAKKECALEKRCHSATCEESTEVEYYFGCKRMNTAKKKIFSRRPLFLLPSRQMDKETVIELMDANGKKNHAVDRIRCLRARILFLAVWHCSIVWRQLLEERGLFLAGVSSTFHSSKSVTNERKHHFENGKTLWEFSFHLFICSSTTLFFCNRNWIIQATEALHHI